MTEFEIESRQQYAKNNDFHNDSATVRPKCSRIEFPYPAFIHMANLSKESVLDPTDRLP